MRRPAPNISCVYCGAEQQAGLLYCPRCGKDPQGPWGTGGDQSPAYIRPDGEAFSNKSASSGLLVGGIMAILAGVLALGNGLLYTIVGGSLPYYDASGVVCFCGGLQILFGMGSLAGGIFAIQRKNFTLAVLGAVVGMLSLAFLIAFVLGLIAVILIASSKDEFRD